MLGKSHVGTLNTLIRVATTQLFLIQVPDRILIPRSDYSPQPNPANRSPKGVVSFFKLRSVK